jgi:two-component system LytT family response regulator
MKYNTLIIEDELPARITLNSYLRKYFDTINVVAELGTVEESVSFLNKTQVDIIFLDIQLKDGKGVDILDRIDSTKYKIIFTTAHEEFALEAFKHRAFGYLLKPLDPTDFKEILNRAIKDLTTPKLEPINNRIRIPISSGYEWIEIDDIIRCEAESNYTKVIVKDTKYIISKTLKHVEHELINSVLFSRVHQSHLVNLNWIDSTQIKNNTITLKNGDEIPVSRAHKDELFQLMKKGRVHS